MANPQTEHGFVQIALDLFVALFTSDLPANDAVVLCWVLLQCYGPYKRRSVYLDFTEIEDYTGLERHNARRAAKSLVAAGYLAESKDGTYRPLKDWEKFQPKRGAFADRLRLAKFAEAVLTNPKFNTPKASKRVGVHSDPTSTPVGVQLDPHDKCNRGPTGPTLQVSGGSTQTPTTVDMTSRYHGANGEHQASCDESLAGACAPASEDKRDGEIGVLTNSRQTDAAGWIEPIEVASFEDLVSEARTLFDGDVARVVEKHRHEILTHFEDRLGYYLAAIRRAKDTRTPIDKPHRWFLKVGKELMAEGPSGLRAKIEPAPVTIPLTLAQQKRQRENEAIDRATRELAAEEL